VFLYDRLSAETTLISVATDGSQGNDESGHVHLSADGRILIFMSRASNLAGIVSFPYWGLFVRDRLGGETWRAAAGVDDLNISADGRFAVSVTEPPNYSTIAVHDLQSGKTSYISAPPRRNFKHQLLISTFHLSRWAIRGVLYI
jgi:hypothetical protein